MGFDRSIIFRILIVIFLAGAALGLYLIDRSPRTEPLEQIQQDIAVLASKIDREADSVLAQFRIDKKWWRKRDVTIQGSDLKRVERKVMIPPEIIPVQVNQALNQMAKRYGGRAIGSENLKENTVTIHIKLEEYIIETIILKISNDLKRAVGQKQQK